jgi:FkbM family methyltransferase
MFSALSAFGALSEPPTTVFDVGAAYGTDDLYRCFPDANFVLIEPLAEFRATLDEVARGLPSAIVIPSAVGSHATTATINVHSDLVGSSLHLEPEDHVNGDPRQVDVTTLDALRESLALPGPFFVKVDTQGHESEVIGGAHDVLADTLGVVLELSLFDFFAGAPSLSSVVHQMAEHGFVLYDVFDRRYRPLDGALAQFDALFVPEHSPLRGSHRYATDEQRHRQTRDIRRTFPGRQVT